MFTSIPEKWQIRWTKVLVNTVLKSPEPAARHALSQPRFPALFHTQENFPHFKPRFPAPFLLWRKDAVNQCRKCRWGGQRAAVDDVETGERKGTKGGMEEKDVTTSNDRASPDTLWIKTHRSYYIHGSMSSLTWFSHRHTHTRARKNNLFIKWGVSGGHTHNATYTEKQIIPPPPKKKPTHDKKAERSTINTVDNAWSTVNRKQAPRITAQLSVAGNHYPFTTVLRRGGWVEVEGRGKECL